MDKIQLIVNESRGIWKNDKQFFTWLRGQLRRIWAIHPIKLTYKTSKEYPAPPGYGRIKKLIDCEICNTPTAKSSVEVDHKKPAGQLRTIEDIRSFIERLLLITWEDLRCLCKPCHAIVTHAEKYNLTFEEARIEKQVIDFMKKSTKHQKYFLQGKGYPESQLSNAKKRRMAYKDYLMREEVVGDVENS